MRVFLTGATGYIGGAVTDVLRAGGHELTGLARSDASAARLTAAGIRPVRGDFSDPSSWDAAARAADAVISLATTYDATVDGPAVDAILDALAGGDKRFIYTSGIWSYGDTGGTVVDETSPVHPAPLVAWRQAVEDRVREGAKRGIRSVVFRPAVVYGRAGGIPAGFTDSARKDGAARFVGTGENRWPLVHVDDLADLYAIALDRAAPGTLLLAVHGPSQRVRDLAAAASRGAGGRRPHRWLAARAGAAEIGRVRRRPRAGSAGVRTAGGGARLASPSPRRARGARARLVREARRVTD